MSGESSSSRMESDQELIIEEQSMPLSQTSTENGPRTADKEQSRSLSQVSTENGASTETYENNWLTWNHVLDIKPIVDGYFLVSIF